MEHYSVEQVIAAIAGQSSIRTVVLLGDMRQRLESSNPNYLPPWVSSSADAPMQEELEERRTGVELDDEGDGEDDKARGPSPALKTGLG